MTFTQPQRMEALPKSITHITKGLKFSAHHQPLGRGEELDVEPITGDGWLIQSIVPAIMKLP